MPCRMGNKVEDIPIVPVNIDCTDLHHADTSSAVTSNGQAVRDTTSGLIRLTVWASRPSRHAKPVKQEAVMSTSCCAVHCIRQSMECTRHRHLMVMPLA